VAYFKVSRYSPGRTEDNRGRLSRSSGRVLTSGPHEYEAPLEHDVRSTYSGENFYLYNSN
jgi:hypothetical protein